MYKASELLDEIPRNLIVGRKHRLFNPSHMVSLLFGGALLHPLTLLPFQFFDQATGIRAGERLGETGQDMVCDEGQDITANIAASFNRPTNLSNGSSSN